MLVLTLPAHAVQQPRRPLFRPAEQKDAVSTRRCRVVIFGQTLTVRFTSGDGRSLTQPNNRIRQTGVSPAAKFFIFTFQFLNLSLPVAQQLTVAFGGGVKLRLRLAAGLRQGVQGNQLAVYFWLSSLACCLMCGLWFYISIDSTGVRLACTRTSKPSSRR